MPAVTRRRFLSSAATVLLPACGGGSNSAAPAPTTPTPPTTPGGIVGPAWFGFGRDAQHSSLSSAATQSLDRILWQTPVDLAPPYSGAVLFAHYASPVVTARNSVILAVRQPTGAYRMEARDGSNGALIWSADSDFSHATPFNWLPSYNVALAADNRLYAPGRGGKLLVRDDANNAATVMRSVVFYGPSAYEANRAAHDAAVFINTPLTIDAAGTVYFGFIVNGNTPTGLASGIARIDANGQGTWISAAMAAQGPQAGNVATNCAPALSLDGRTVYVVVADAPRAGFLTGGKLVALDSATLSSRTVAPLLDPASGTPAWINDNGTSSPVVGPDGDVYIGVLEANPPAHRFTGWLLHFDAALSRMKTPGAFGWDNTPSIVPAAMLPSYAGRSGYLLLCKYNNYAQGGGDGGNRMAVLDPGDTQVDKILGNPVMKEVLTQLGPTPDPAHPGGVYEWCVNVAAVDPSTRSVLVNSEDGFLYRWDLASNALTQRIRLNTGVGQAYTPTAVGPDGVVYSINNATLVAAGR